MKTTVYHHYPIGLKFLYPNCTLHVYLNIKEFECECEYQYQYQYQYQCGDPMNPCVNQKESLLTRTNNSKFISTGG
jgi:hypothetical protein